MFMLTEGTLFFLDLALNSRIQDKKPSLSSVVQKWVDGVAAATDGTNTTTGASSTLYVAAPVYPSPAVGQTSPTRGSGVINDKDAGDTVVIHRDGALVGTSGMTWQQEASRAVKRKVDDTDIEFDVESDGNGDHDMDLEELVLEDASPLDEMVGSTAKRSCTHTPPTKKVKHEDPLVPLLSAARDTTVGRVSAMPMIQPQARQRQVVDNEGYIIEVIKKRSEYTNMDLPVPCDRRWSHSFISTAILWYSVQKNIWNVPKEELVSALQRIFNVVYPDIKYRVNPTGSVFALTVQRIDEWRCSFGSSALAMMLHFFSSLNDDGDIHSAVEFLATDFRFLREDPDSSEPTDPFRSPFLLMLIAITHLGDISAFVDVPEWDTRAMAAGKDGEGVIALASAALERALSFFCDGTLDVDQVLAEIARCTDAPMTVRTLRKTVLDTLAGRDIPTALRFSAANWSGPTAAYRESIRKRGTAFVQETFVAAQAKRRRMANDMESEAGDDASMSDSEMPDPRALL